MRQLTTNRDAARIMKSELASLREVLGFAADLLLALAWETLVRGSKWVYVKPGSISAERMKTARRKLQDYGLVRTEFRPGRGYAYQVVDPEGLDMLIPAFDEGCREQAAKQHVGA